MSASIKRSRLGPADLLRAWQRSADQAEFALEASLLGFAYRRSQSTELNKPPDQAAKATEAADETKQNTLADIEFAPSKAKDRPASTLYAVTKRRRVLADQQGLSSPPWVNSLPALESDAPWDANSRPSAWQGLTRKPKLQAVLRQQLIRNYNSAQPDTDKIIDKITRGLSLHSLPMQPISRRLPGLHVLVDESRHLRTMLPDALTLYKSLSQRWGDTQLSLQGTLSDPGWPIRQQQIDSGVGWVIVSDLGIFSNSAARAEWQRLLHLLASKKVPCLILSPVSPALLGSQYHAGLPAYSWDRDLRAVAGKQRANIAPANNQIDFLDKPRGTSGLTQQEPIAKNQSVDRLLAAISICYRVEAGLLRALRVHLRLSVDAEAHCRLHADIADDGVYVQLKQHAQNKHRGVFKSDFTSAQQQAVVGLVTQHHAPQVQSILDQELDIAAMLCKDTVKGASQAKQRLRQLAITLHKNPGNHLLRCWSKSQLDLQTGDDRQRNAHFFAGLHQEALNNGEQTELDLPKGLSYADLLPYMDGNDEIREFDIKQDSTGLYLQAKHTGDQQSLDQHKARGQFTLATIEARGDRLLVNGDLLALSKQTVSLQSFTTPIAIETGVETLTIVDISLSKLGGAEAIARSGDGVFFTPAQHRLPKQYAVEQLPFPSWASVVKQDEWGIYAELETPSTEPLEQAIKQGFRWIPAGQFMMGSPQDEIDRSYYEDYHQVTLSQGFWLADTACSQAVWQAVMSNNPSEFKLSAQHPLENLSWQDVQEFMQRINQQIPSLNAALPSEAQWEYACRGASISAFNIGETISSKQVNFNGNFPYSGAPKSDYREQTVLVNSLSQNDWGLYQMHGNVWEWCQDYWQAELGTQAVTDPITTTDGGENRRVLRGGSWFYGGRSCRSAIRNRLPAGNRDSDCGFRLSLGQELQSSSGGATISKKQSQEPAEQAFARKNAPEE